MRFFLVIAFLLLALRPLVFGQAADQYEPRIFSTADGGQLGYRLLQPRNPIRGQKYPLVVLLHGSEERGSDNVAQLKHGAPLFLQPEVRTKFPCFVLVPQCPAALAWSAVAGWTGATAFEEEPAAPMKLVLGLLDAVLKEFPIDRDRLYLTGLSMGGFGVWDMLSRQPQRWAAAVPICGGGDPARIAPAKGLAVWAFHGVDDSAVPVARSREMVAALTAAGGAPLYSEYPYVAHESWPLAYQEPELLPWMFAQKRGAVVPWERVAQPLSQPPSNLCPGEGPMQSGLWFRALWKNRRDQWARSKAADQGAVVFFGDSITQGWATLTSDFSHLKVVNRGLSGDTTRGLRTRLQGDVLDLKPAAVSILIGTNDLDQGGDPETVAENLRAIVTALHAASPKMPIIINKVMPRGSKPDLFPQKIQELNALFEEAFRSDAMVTFCDTWTLFDDGTGVCRAEEFPDMLHPNITGYIKWRKALRPILDRVVPAK